MRINKKFAALAITAGVAGTSALGGLVMAQSADSTYPPIVDKIAEKFNLNKDEVKKVFDEQKSEHETEHKKQLEEKLAQAVKDGKLTEDQKTKLLAKFEEMHKNREQQREANQEEREAARQDFEKWAEDNGINLDEVLPKMEGQKFGHRGGHVPF